MKRFAGGMTLLELMIVVAIVAILAAIAVPNYRAYVMRANRSDATAALLRVAAAQEKFYLQANTYASNAQLATDPPAGLGFKGTEHGWYAVTIADTNAGGLTAGYTATATVVGGTVQAADSSCKSFTITETGARDALASDDTTSNKATCWR